MGGGKNPLMQKIRKIDNSWKSFNTRTIGSSPASRSTFLHTTWLRFQLPPAPPLALPDTSGEILKARMAQALRAFLCLPLSEDIQLNPVIIGIRLGIR